MHKHHFLIGLLVVIVLGFLFMRGCFRCVAGISSSSGTNNSVIVETADAAGE